MNISFQTQIGRALVLMETVKPLSSKVKREFPNFDPSEIEILNATIDWTAEINSMSWGVEIGKKTINRITVHAVVDGLKMDLNFTSKNAEIKIHHESNDPSRKFIAPIELSIKIISNKNQISITY